MKNMGRQISPRSLPDFAQPHLDERVPLPHPVAEIEAMLKIAESDGALKLTLPHGQDLLQVMNHQVGNPYQRITSIYWSLSAPAIAGVLDRIRTALVELVAEVRTETPNDADEPSSEIVDRAISIAIHGGSPHVNVTTATASGSGSHTVTAESTATHTLRVEAVWPKLREELAELGLPGEELEDLHGALLSDGDPAGELGPATTNWLGKVSAKLATGALAVGGAASSDAISHVLLKALGIG